LAEALEKCGHITRFGSAGIKQADHRHRRLRVRRQRPRRCRAAEKRDELGPL
jgi:hypothetical protein